VKLDRIDHIGVAVEDLDAAIALYEQSFAMALAHRETVESQGVEAVLLGVGVSHVELLRPLAPDTAVGKFLERSGPGLHLHGAVGATVKFSAIVGNGRETGDHQPGFMLDSSLPVELIGNTIANNGGPAISQPQVSSAEILAKNLFSLEGRKGRLEDIRVTRKRTHP